jgi:hypothetical protein
MQPSEDLPLIATNALLRGVDSQSLRELAGTRLEDYQDARDLFEKVCDELGIIKPTPEEARWQLVYEWAAAVTSGAMTPIDAARRIWWDGWEELGRPDSLTTFVGLTSQWEDDPAHRDDFNHEIRAAAASLLAQRS